MLSWATHNKNHLRTGQLVKPRSRIRFWLVSWPLMGSSAGEDLFPVFPVWRWDNRAGQPCYIFSGRSACALYTKECQGALWKVKTKGLLLRGVIPNSEPKWEDLLLRKGKIFHWAKGLVFLKSQQGSPPWFLSFLLTLVLSLRPSLRARNPLPCFLVEFCAADRILTESSKCLLALGQLSWVTDTKARRQIRKYILFIYLSEEKPLLDPKKKKWANMRLI